MLLSVEMALTLEANLKEKESLVAFKRMVDRSTLDSLLQHTEHPVVCLFLLLFFVDCPDMFSSPSFLSYVVTHPPPTLSDTPRLDSLKTLLRDIAPTPLVTLVRITHLSHD